MVAEFIDARKLSFPECTLWILVAKSVRLLELGVDEKMQEALKN